MKSFLPLARRELAIFLVLFLGGFSTFSQTFTPKRGVGIVPHCNGYYEYLPQGYETGTETYPLLIFNHGTGESGDGNAGITKLVNTGLPKLINTGGFPTSFTVNGEVFRFIVICPQYTSWPTVADVDAVLNYALGHYRVNTNRIYMTGLSMGGGITWDFAAQAKLVVKLAAMVPICGASSESKQKAKVIADAGLPVWATHNLHDPTVNVNTTINYINDILARNPSAPVKYTIFNASGHDAWTKTYNPSFEENNMNIYEWMLQYQLKGTGVNVPPTVNAGTDVGIALPTNSVTMNATASDPDGSVTKYAWSKTAGPKAFKISDPSALNPTISGLTIGTYTFRLTVTDNNKATSFDDINIVVAPVSNQPPSVNAGNDITITLPTSSVPMKATVLDPDGSISKYAWTKTSGPAAFSISNTAIANPTISGLTAGTYTFRLTVTDNSGATAFDDMNIVVNPAPVKPPPVNVPPTVSAGADVTITLPTRSATMNATASDPDGSISKYAWTKTSGPAAFSISNTAIANPTISGLTAGTYTFRLTVTDNSGATAFDDMNIVVDPAPVKPPPVNVPPTVSAGADVTITLPTRSATMNATASDPDGSISKYAWTKTSGPAAFSISNTAIANPTISGLTAGTYTFRLTVTDNSGATAFDDMNIVVNPAPVKPPPVNVPPTVSAGADVTITLPTRSATMNATASDPDGSISKYAWTKTSGPAAFSISNTAIANPTISGLTAGTYTFRLTVTDNSGATAFDDMNIVVDPAPVKPPPVNVPPTVSAGADVTITLPTRSATMNATASDPDGSISKYAWTKTSGPAAFSISNTAIANPTISGLTAGTYTFRLTVTDNSGATAFDDMNIVVNPAPVKPPPVNVPPTVSAGADVTITLPTRSATMNATASDPDGSISKYAWTKTSGPAAFSISNTAIANPTISGLTAGTYTFRLTVSDNSSATTFDDINIIVNPPADQPPTVNAGADITITLPTNSALMKATASDPDGSIAKYAWTKIAGPAAYSISNNAALSPTMNGLGTGTYTFRLTVTDNKGATTHDDINIIVKAAVNQSPDVSAGADVTIALPTSSVLMKATASDPDGSIAKYTWTKAAGPVAYTISDASVINPTISGLTAGIYTFSLSVTDNSGATAFDDINIVVNPAPIIPPTVDAPPTVNTGADITITLPINSVVMKTTASDPDGTIAKYAWTKAAGPALYTISDASLPNPTISGLTAGTYTFSLTVTDNKGATALDDINIIVNSAPTLAPPVNTPPTVNAGNDVTITLPTNSVVMKATASDPGGSIAKYVWTKVAGPSSYSISDISGLNPTVVGLVAGTYIFRLAVTDNSGISAYDDINIIVIPGATPPPNVSPVVNAGTDATINLPTNSVVMKATASDPDGSIAKYAWTKAAGPSSYSISDASVLNPTINGLVAGTYTFRLSVTDNTGVTAYDDIIISVHAATNQLPVANAGQNQTITAPAEAALDGTNSYDPDGVIVQYLWTLQSGNAGAVISDPYSPEPTVSGLSQGEYVFKLTVTDDDGASVSDLINITVNQVVPVSVPVALAGLDTAITYPEYNTIELNGNASYDIGGTIASYSWNQLDGPSTVSMDNATGSVNQVSGMTVGDYNFVLTITDNNGIVASDTVTVHVKSSQRTVGFVKVYPNPVSTGMIYLEGVNQSTGKVLVNVYDISGRVMKKLEFEKVVPPFKYEVFVGGFPNGVYVISVMFNGSVVPTAFPFVKQ